MHDGSTCKTQPGKSPRPLNACSLGPRNARSGGSRTETHSPLWSNRQSCTGQPEALAWKVQAGHHCRRQGQRRGWEEALRRAQQPLVSAEQSPRSMRAKCEARRAGEWTSGGRLSGRAHESQDWEVKQTTNGLATRAGPRAAASQTRGCEPRSWGCDCQSMLRGPTSTAA